jgi:hypothetical protein
MRVPVTTLSGLALILGLAAAPALGQTSKPPADAPNAVAPVTIMPPTQKPKVAATWPAAGATVAPGVLVLKITFDQQMTPRDFDYGLGAGADALSCLKTPRLLNDNKTFVLLCTTLPGKTYAIALNQDPARKDPTGRAIAFSNLAENRAEPSALTFTTGTGDPVTKLSEAVKAAGLGGLDIPIEEAPQLATTTPAAARP